MKIRIVIASFLLCFYLPDFAQHSNINEKIDPVFMSLINQQRVTDSIVASTCRPRTTAKPGGGKVPKNTPVEKKYECIVYTKYAKALRTKGIIINSELSAFVTAIATLKQIEQMSVMPEVTYIAAPSTNIIH